MPFPSGLSNFPHGLANVLEGMSYSLPPLPRGDRGGCVLAKRPPLTPPCKGGEPDARPFFGKRN